MEISELKECQLKKGEKKMIKFIRKVMSTVKVIGENLEELMKEVNDLTGVTRVVVKELLRIWK